jgi:hypothetical protein
MYIFIILLMIKEREMTGSSDAHEDGVFISTELMEIEQGITSKW